MKHGAQGAWARTGLMMLMALMGPMAGVALAQGVPAVTKPGPSAAAQATAGSAPTAVAAAGPKASSQAEAQLEAIRRALIDKAMGSTTRVSSTAWLNEKGELMEASQFRTDMQVRGVRVLEYVGEEEPRAVVQVQDSQSAPAVPACREPDSRETWRHPLALRVQVDRPQDPQWATVSQQAGRWLEQALRGMAQAEGATLDPYSLPPVRNRYEEALLSFPQPRSTLVLTVRLRLQEGWEPGRPGARRHLWEARAREWLEWRPADRRAMTLRVDWDLARVGEAPLLQQRSLLPVVVDTRGRPTAMFEDATRHMVLQEAAHRWQALQGTLDCEPLVYEARPVGDGQVMLMAGIDAGLRVGDRLVLVDGRHVPSRLLEAEAAPHLALLEVQRVQGQRAQARQVAGPRLAMDGSQDWVAMPFGATLMAARQEAMR